MSRGGKRRDYDEALPEAIELTFKGETFRFSPEAPLDVALEWMDRQATDGGASAWERLGETQTEYTFRNFECLFREHWDRMREIDVGFSSLNEAYVDLLGWWKLWKRPESTDAEIALNRIQVIVASAIDNEMQRNQIGALLDQVRERLGELEERETEDENEKETAGNPA